MCAGMWTCKAFIKSCKMIEGHGDDIRGYARPIVSNFSSNVFYAANQSGLAEHLYQAVASVRNYPEPAPLTLEQELANHHNVLPHNVCATNGATEAIYLIAQAFRGSRTAILEPTFSEYEDACKVHEHRITYAFLLDEIPPDAALVWICNPNNPTGQVIDHNVLSQFIQTRPQSCFVIDQSYERFTAKRLFEADEATALPNLILLHSMTKHYAIPGLRLGYLTASEKLADKIKYYRMPWPINQLTLKAGLYLLKNNAQSDPDINYFREECQWLKQQLVALGIEVSPTDTNFMLCRLRLETASRLKAWLANTHGYLIRDASNFKGLDERYFRIAAQTHAENVHFVEYIRQWLR